MNYCIIEIKITKDENEGNKGKIHINLYTMIKLMKKNLIIFILLMIYQKKIKVLQM